MSALRLALEQEKEERWEKLQRRLEAVQQRRVARLNEMQRRSLTQSSSSSMDVLDEEIVADGGEEIVAGGDGYVIVKHDETILEGKDKNNHNSKNPHNVNCNDEGTSQIDSLSVEDKRVKGVRGGATTVSGPGLGQHVNHHDNDRNSRVDEKEEDKENATETSSRSTVTQLQPQSKSQSSSQSQPPSHKGLEKAIINNNNNNHNNHNNNNNNNNTTTTINNTPTDVKLTLAVTTTTSSSSSQSKEKKKKHKKRSGVGSGQEEKDDDWLLLVPTKTPSVSVKAGKTVPVVPVGGTRTPIWHAYACSLLLDGTLKKKNVWLARQAAFSSLNVTSAGGPLGGGGNSSVGVEFGRSGLFDLYLEIVKRPSSVSVGANTNTGASPGTIAGPGPSPCLSSVDGLLRVLCLAPGLTTTTATATTSPSTVTPQSICEALLVLFARLEGTPTTPTIPTTPSTTGLCSTTVTTSAPSLVPGASSPPCDPKREMGLFLRQGGMLLLRALLGGDGGVLTGCLPAASSSSSPLTSFNTSGGNGTSSLSSSSPQPLSLCILRTPRLLPSLCRALCTAASVMSHAHQPTLVDQVT